MAETAPFPDSAESGQPAAPAAPGRRAAGFLLAMLAIIAGLGACTSSVRMVDRPSGPLPWSAAIGRLDSQAAGGSCSATLVKRDVILTASHCLYGRGDTVRIIDFAFTPALDAGRERLRPVKVASLIAMGWPIDPQKGWEENEKAQFDWALLRLAQPIDYVEPLPVERIAVPAIEQRLAAGATLSHAGFGVYGLGSGKRLQVRSQCQLLKDREESSRIGKDVIKNSCAVIQGDSGGPILLTSADGKRSVIGIITNFWRSHSGDTASYGPSSANFAGDLFAAEDHAGALPAASSEILPTP